MKATKHKENSNWLLNEIDKNKAEISLVEENEKGFILVGTLDDILTYVKKVLKKRSVSIFTKRQIQARLIIQLTNKYGLQLNEWS